MGEFLLGIDIGGTKVALATATPSGTRLVESRVPTSAEEGAQEVVRRVLAAAQDLTERTARLDDGVHGAAPMAVGVASPGVIREHGVLLAPANPGWENLPLRARIQEAFPAAAIAVLNDVRAAALAEATHGALRDVGTGLFVNLGTGLSTAVVVDGVVLEGAHGGAGEIAYQVLSAADPAFTDGHAPLEEQVSGGGLAARAGELLGRPVTTAEAFATAAVDPRLRSLLDDAADLLAVHLANLCVVLDPERVVLGGGLAARWPGLLPRLSGLLARVVPFPPEVQQAVTADDCALSGALVAAAAAAERVGSRPC